MSQEEKLRRTANRRELPSIFENKVTCVFAYDLAVMFRLESEIYKDKFEAASNKLKYYKQHSIY